MAADKNCTLNAACMALRHLGFLPKGPTNLTQTHTYIILVVFATKQSPKPNHVLPARVCKVRMNYECPMRVLHTQVGVCLALCSEGSNHSWRLRMGGSDVDKLGWVATLSCKV